MPFGNGINGPISVETQHLSRVRGRHCGQHLDRPTEKGAQFFVYVHLSDLPVTVSAEDLKIGGISKTKVPEPFYLCFHTSTVNKCHWKLPLVFGVGTSNRILASSSSFVL